MYHLFMEICSDSDPVQFFLRDVVTKSEALGSDYRRYTSLFGNGGAFRLAFGGSSDGYVQEWYAEVFDSTLFVVIYGDAAGNNAAVEMKYESKCVEWFEKLPKTWGVSGGIFQMRTRSGSRIIAEAGAVADEIIIEEPVGRFKLMPRRGMNPGLFLDARNARRYVSLNSKGKNVLNLFAYTCGFSVAAITGGAQKVVNVDMKGQFLDWGRDNHRLNALDMRKAVFEKLDVMKSFGRLSRFGPYDMIICDPPTFQGKSFSRIKDFPRLLRRCLPMVSPGGLLITLINDSGAEDDYVWSHIKDADVPEAALFKPLSSIAPCPDYGRSGARAMVFRREDTALKQ